MCSRGTFCSSALTMDSSEKYESRKFLMGLIYSASLLSGM